MKTVRHQPSATSASAARLTRDEFARRLEASARLFWCIAAGILGRRQGADDVVQEAAMIALSKLDEFDPATSFNAWVSQIVRFTALNQARRHDRREAAPLQDDVSSRPARPGSAVTSDGRVMSDQQDFDDEVLRALATLEAMPRACLLLRVVMELSYADISQALSIPEGSAMSHVHRARRSLRERLESSHHAPRPHPAGAPR